MRTTRRSAGTASAASVGQRSSAPATACSFIMVMVGFIAASLILAIHIFRHPHISAVRKILAATLDTGPTTYFLFNSAEYAAPLYSLYLWIIFGYGFRYGNRYLLLTMALALLGFGVARRSPMASSKSKASSFRHRFGGIANRRPRPRQLAYQDFLDWSWHSFFLP